MKHRLARVNEVIKRELGEMIMRHCRFDAQLVTIQQVDITPDLKHAHVFVSVIGSQPEQYQAMAQLHAARKELQRDLAKRVVLKFTPHLHFKLDEASARGDRVLNILSDLKIPEDEPSADTDSDTAS
ncbi:MAG: 30S ribosome-binding factor RbfA [Chthoniobacteraceae bacterium]